MPVGLLDKMSKKSQIQIMETIAVLFVFFMLVAIGIVFYTNIYKSNLQGEQEAESQSKSVTIAQRVMFLPELQCSGNNIIKDNCIDLLKLSSAAAAINGNDNYKLDYYDLLEYSDVNVQEIYPDPAKKWSLYSRKIPSFKSSFVTNAPVSLYDPISKSYSFGVLTIETTAK